MGPITHEVRPDLDNMSPVPGSGRESLAGQPALGDCDYRSVCVTCKAPIICYEWPFTPWRHMSAAEEAALAILNAGDAKAELRGLSAANR
jgi:hypothetical protein